MTDLHDDVEVPSFFLCPILLEIMKDPVTLSTGITYDRDSIEKWLFVHKKGVCPVTKQVVDDIELTPNHTLRRLIQSWCALNPSSGVQNFPTPRIPITKTEIIKLLNDSKLPHMQTNSLKRLKTVVLENEMNKRLMESVGAVDQLASIVNNMKNSITSSSPPRDTTPADEALSILYHLNLSPTGLKSLSLNTGDFMEMLTNKMQRGASRETRTYAVMLTKSILEGTKATLKILINVCGWGRNRIKAAEAGVVPVLIETLLNSTKRRVSEMILVLLDQICECAEGRAELLNHAGGLAVVSKKIFRVSSVASEKAVRILHSVAKFSGNQSVLQEMLQVGVVGKLCLVVQVECGKKMKGHATEVLKMHSRVWKSSSCIPYNLISSYPC
ncbi:E3 ubiquitin-protein ligase PUB23 isoform X2 [Helianthus annuus]|uniref:E3 ubiquitin-protein ligase PUB23 isoform X2 n=1 Tax=Helianthus annuus TaxID=4232 RepID=UPI001652F818|nr:E3 ubiquitin-protein ligase PUB23 isoform X2 [Helianthus annuus]